MSEWAQIGLTMLKRHSIVMQHYLIGRTAGEIVNRTGLPRCAVEQEIAKQTRNKPALIGRHMRARTNRPEPVSRWPKARLVIVGREWHESDGEWAEMKDPRCNEGQVRTDDSISMLLTNVNTEAL